MMGADLGNRRKRILIDASSVRNTADGLSTYIVALIEHLPADSRNRYDYSVLVNPGVARDDLDRAIAAAGATVVRHLVAGIGPRRDWQFAGFLRKYRGHFDLIHIPANTYPLALKGGVCTVHDVIFRRWLDGRWARLAQAYMSLVIRHCLRRADRIIAVSQFTKDELSESFAATQPQRDRITVIHEGWEHAARWHPDACASGESGHLFFLGSYRVHKNLTNLLGGFARALPRLPVNRKLMISGMPSRLTDEQRRLVEEINAAGERVIFTGYLSDDCVARRYRDAGAFILPSFTEGFGLPVLEAAYFGAPLLVAKAGALPEVAGSAAIYFDPQDCDQIADAIVRIFCEPELTRGLVERGRALLDAYSWQRAANETVRVYDDVFADRAS